MSAPTRRLIIDDTPELLDDFEQYPQDRGATKKLKPPPEIWELVHPVAANKYKPGKVLATRLARRSVLTILVGSLVLVGLTIALWKFPIVQNVVAMLPKDEAPSKPRTSKTAQSRVVKTDSESKVFVTPNPETSTPSTDELPSPDVISTSITSQKVLKQTYRKFNRPRIETHSVSALSTLPTPSAESSSEKRSIGKAAAEVPVKPQIKANATVPEANSPPDSKQSPKPKVIPWP